MALAPVTWHEIGESRAAGPAQRKQEEGAGLARLAGDAQAIITLDERGKMLSSEARPSIAAIALESCMRLIAARGLAPRLTDGQSRVRRAIVAM